MSAPQISTRILELNRTFAAPREKVFRAWTEAEELARWFSPTDDYTVVVPQLELHVGGTWRLEMHHKGGAVHKLFGTYREISRPEKLAFTWRWESNADSEETLVTVEFRSVGNSTEVALTHEGFASDEERGKHTHGWTGCFDRFARTYNSRALPDSLLAELEQESQTTRKLLERIPDDKLSWRPHAKSFTLGKLALHIAAAPGAVASAAVHDTFEVPSEPQAEGASRAAILAEFSRGLGQAKEALATMDDTRVFANFTATKDGKPLMVFPRIGFLRSIMLNHLYHHRGQLTVYLRLLDVPVPSVYGPSADENPWG
jgi:uncharacterized protein YndB with AHSA1/START domain/uncharacterized damage-inducible protein DinB